jgi:hypothetical protein
MISSSINRIFPLFFILSCFLANGQSFCDTLITKKGDTITCKINLVNEYNVFYSYKHKKNTTRDSSIPRVQLISLRLHTPGVSVPALGENAEEVSSTSTVYHSERNGIIYATNVEHPPAYPRGINKLYNFLENSVTATNRDYQTYGDNVVTVLYELVILNDGKLYGAGIKESCIDNFGLNPYAEHLEREIMKQICLAGPWEPGSMRDEKINMNIYLPIKFKVDKNRIIIYPCEYTYTFKHRKK